MPIQLKQPDIKPKENTNTDSEFLRVVFKQVIEEKQLVFGEVYAPNMVDTDWEAMAPEDVEYAAHNFMKNNYIDSIDIQHSLEKSGAVVVESYIVRTPDDPFYSEGAWVMGVWVPEEIWEDVKSGKLNAFSFYGTSIKYPVEVVIEVTTLSAGETEPSQDSEKSVDSHTHTFVIRLDEKGSILSGYTSFDQNHQHAIKITSATEEAMGHAHRFFVE